MDASSLFRGGIRQRDILRKYYTSLCVGGNTGRSIVLLANG